MRDVVTEYLTLGLRLGRHVDGLVDAYYGPTEIADAVSAEGVVAPEALASDAEALLGAIGHSDLEPQRQAWLTDQIRGLGTYASALAGEQIPYSDEVERCYGVRPEAGLEETYREAHARLDELFPGSGSLFERANAWRSGRKVDPGRMIPAVNALVSLLRGRTERLLDLPAGEGLVVDEVHDEPWWAFNYYLGNLRSRVALNADTLMTPWDLATLVAHECYPGHHTERAVKEQLLIRDGGYLEESIKLVPTPEAVVSEGIAETGLGFLLDDELLGEIAAVLSTHGLDDDLELALAIDRARTPLRGLGVDAALLIHEEGASREQAQAHIERWGLRTPEQAAQSVRFVTDPTWRTYVITYSAGEDLCEAYVGGDPTRFRRLLTEQVRVTDLLAART